MENEIKKRSKVMEFLITTLNGMAFGLFATLIIGTIISTIGGFFPKAEEVNSFTSFMYIVLTNTGSVLSCITGAGIGVGIALALKLDTLKTIVLAAAGEIAAFFSLSTKFVTDGIQTWGKFQIGDPLTIYLVVNTPNNGINKISTGVFLRKTNFINNAVAITTK